MNGINQSTLHGQSQIIATSIIQQILKNRFETDVLPSQLIFQACLHDSLVIQNSVFNIYSNQLNQQPKKLAQNQQCRPLSLNFKVRKPHLVHVQTQKKIIRSKSSACNNLHSATKNNKNIQSSGQNMIQLAKTQAQKLNEAKQSNSKRRRVRYSSILNQNPNIRQIFKYHFDHAEDKNDTIQRILRQRKKNQVPFLQKSQKSVQLKKCETKRAKDQQKKILSVNTDYEGFPVLLCRTSQMNIPNNYIQMNFIVLDEKVEYKDGNQSRRTKKTKKRQEQIKIIEPQHLKFAEEKDLFSRKFIQKIPMQNRQDMLSENNIEEIEKMDFRTRARNLPSKVSFQSLFKLKCSDTIGKEQKKPLQRKKKKTITFSYNQKSLKSTLSRNSTQEEYSTSKLSKKNRSKVVLGNQSAFNLLFNCQERQKFENLSEISKDN